MVGYAKEQKRQKEEESGDQVQEMCSSSSSEGGSARQREERIAGCRGSQATLPLVLELSFQGWVYK